MPGLASCKYCNKIHDKYIVCSKKPIYKKNTELDKFRWSSRWHSKRDSIKERDQYLCRVCLKLDKALTYNYLEVHHIDPLAKAWDKRLDDTNLITLCRLHHEQAEKGVLKADYLRSLISPRCPKI